MSIGETIKSLRQQRGLSQKSLGRLAGIPVVTLQQYERGVRQQPKVEQLKRISNALNVSVDYLVKGGQMMENIPDHPVIRNMERTGYPDGKEPTYPKIAKALGLSVNTVAKYVTKLEEHGLITTEHTQVTTKAGLKRNGCLKYHIENIQYAVDIFNERQLAELQHASDIEKAKKTAAKKGIDYRPPESEQSA